MAILILQVSESYGKELESLVGRGETMISAYGWLILRKPPKTVSGPMNYGQDGSHGLWRAQQRPPGNRH